MFDIHASGLFIATDGVQDCIWHDGDNPNGPDMLETRSTLDRRLWDVLESILPNRDGDDDACTEECDGTGWTGNPRVICTTHYMSNNY